MQKKTFTTNIIGSLLCITTITLLVPIKGIIGFVLAMLLQSGFVCCQLLSHVLRYVDLRVDLNHWIFKPTLAGIACSFISVSFNRYLLVNYCSPAINTILSILILGGTYLMFLILIGSFSIKDIKGFMGARS